MPDVGWGGVSGAENVGTAQGGDVEEESPRKGVCRGGDVEGLREQSPGGEGVRMVEGPGKGKSGGGGSEWGAHRGKGGHGGGGSEGRGQGALQRGAFWLSCSWELKLCRAVPKPTLSPCHSSPAVLKSDMGCAWVEGKHAGLHCVLGALCSHPHKGHNGAKLLTWICVL